MKAFTNEPLGIKGPSQPVDGEDDGGNFAIVDGKGMIIGEAIRLVAMGDERPALANAVLWSISPQMLDALEQCEKSLAAMAKGKFGFSKKQYGGVTVGKLLGYVRGVISKAEWRPADPILSDDRVLQVVKGVSE